MIVLFVEVFSFNCSFFTIMTVSFLYLEVCEEHVDYLNIIFTYPSLVAELSA
jgi:hypothetical protein